MIEKAEAMRLINRWIEEIDVKQTAENLDEILASDWVVHQPGTNKTIEEVKEFYKKRFSEGVMSDVVEDVIICGDMVVVRWTEGFTPHSTGVRVCNAAITIDRIKNSKFAETWYLWSDKPWIKEDLNH